MLKNKYCSTKAESQKVEVQTICWSSNQAKQSEKENCCSSNTINTVVKDECCNTPSMIENENTKITTCCSGSGKTLDPVNIILDVEIKEEFRVYGMDCVHSIDTLLSA